MSTRIGPSSDLPPGSVTRVDRYAVGNNGDYFAVSGRCRHLGGPLAEGKIDQDGCLVCPWHQAKYDTSTGRMVGGPQGFYAKVPGLGASFKALTKVLPLRRKSVAQRGDELFLED